MLQTVSKITSLPEGIERREWIAHNVLGLFEHVNSLCGTLTEVCTQTSCPHMSFPGTSKAVYQDERGKRQYYPAMQYIDCVITQCETMSQKEEIFPTKYGELFNSLGQKSCRIQFVPKMNCKKCFCTCLAANSCCQNETLFQATSSMTTSSRRSKKWFVICSTAWDTCIRTTGTFSARFNSVRNVRWCLHTLESSEERLTC